MLIIPAHIITYYVGNVKWSIGKICHLKEIHPYECCVNFFQDTDFTQVHVSQLPFIFLSKTKIRTYG